MVPVLRGIAFDNDEEAEAYLVVSNQATTAGGWNETLLAELLRDHAGGAGLRGMGFSEADLADLLLKAANANEIQHDEPALGHRRSGKEMGDETWPALADRAAPACRFNIAARSKDPTKLGKVANDDRANWALSLQTAGASSPTSGTPPRARCKPHRRSSKPISSCAVRIIWRKQHFAISRGHYHWQHEPSWYAVKKGQSGRWGGDRTQTSVWDISAAGGFGRSTKPEDEPTGHSTQKPVECMAPTDPES
jgi:hypothetical protein